MKRGYDYAVKFTIKEVDGAGVQTPMDLTGVTPTYMIDGKALGTATVASPATAGVVDVLVDEVDTIKVDRGRWKAWLQVVNGSDKKYYGEYFVEVWD